MKTIKLLISLILFFGSAPYASSDEKNCFFDICDGDTLSSLKKKGYVQHLSYHKYIYSKEREFEQYKILTMGFAQASDDETICLRKVIIYNVEKWDKKKILKLLSKFPFSIKLEKELPDKDPLPSKRGSISSKYFSLKVDGQEGSLSYVEIKKGERQLRISYNPCPRTPVGEIITTCQGWNPKFPKGSRRKVIGNP